MQATNRGFWYELHCCEQPSMTSGTGSESVALKKRGSLIIMINSRVLKGAQSSPQRNTIVY